MYDIKTLYNNGNALVIADRGDYAELLSINDKQIKPTRSGSQCRWWHNNGVRFLGRIYKPIKED